MGELTTKFMVDPEGRGGRILVTVERTPGVDCLVVAQGEASEIVRRIETQPKLVAMLKAVQAAYDEASKEPYDEECWTEFNFPDFSDLLAEAEPPDAKPDAGDISGN